MNTHAIRPQPASRRTDIIAPNYRPFVPYKQFVKAIQDKQIILAWADGDVHRVTFRTNEFSVTTGTFARRRTDGRWEDRPGSWSPLTLSASADGRYLVLRGPAHSPAGTFKHPFLIFVPMTQAFLDTCESPVRANLRWNDSTDWQSGLEAAGFLRPLPQIEPRPPCDKGSGVVDLQ